MGNTMFTWDSSRRINCDNPGFNMLGCFKTNRPLIKRTISDNQTRLIDCGSPEAQIQCLSARIGHLSKHLQLHTHDNATKRGLTIIIGKRLGLLHYLEKKDYEMYSQICKSLGKKL